MDRTLSNQYAGNFGGGKRRIPTVFAKDLVSVK